MSAERQEHEYHLVDPSPWPVLCALSAFIVAVGTIMAFQGVTMLVLVVGLLALIYGMSVWWRDVIREAQHDGHHTPVVQLHHRYGVILFIVSEVMFFVAWFWAFVDFRLVYDSTVQVARSELTGAMWPPKDIITFIPWDLPLINTLVLLLSGTTVTWAHYALIQGDRKGLIAGLIATVVLGAFFTLLQGVEYSHAGFTFAGHTYGSSFFMATGFHGFHVIVGTIFLFVCLMRARVGHFSPKQHFGFEAAAWYWHFVDVVWLLLFVIVYVWGA